MADRLLLLFLLLLWPLFSSAVICFLNFLFDKAHHKQNGWWWRK